MQDYQVPKDLKGNLLRRHTEGGSEVATLSYQTWESIPVSRVIPLRFPGGKFYALNQLKRFYSCVDHDEYREPMAGGATVFFGKPKVKHNWLNDIDGEVINFYQAIANQSLRNELVQLVSSETASKERWSEVRKLRPSGELERAFKFFYMNRTSFSGKLSSPAWGYRPKRSLPPERWQERLVPCGEKLEGVILTSVDFVTVITTPRKGQNCLLYVDPPYYRPPRRKHYVNGFELQDHLRLCSLLKDTPHKFFLTYDDVPEVKELYRWANIYPLNFTYRVENSATQEGRRRMGAELVITNFRVPEATKIEDFD